MVESLKVLLVVREKTPMQSASIAYKEAHIAVRYTSQFVNCVPLDFHTYFHILAE